MTSEASMTSNIGGHTSKQELFEDGLMQSCVRALPAVVKLGTIVGGGAFVLGTAVGAAGIELSKALMQNRGFCYPGEQYLMAADPAVTGLVIGTVLAIATAAASVTTGFAVGANPDRGSNARYLPCEDWLRSWRLF